MALEYKGKRLALNVDIRKIVSGGGYDIYYGDTAPTDTSKLWIKGTEPTSLEITGTEPMNKKAVEKIEFDDTIYAETSGACASYGEYIYIFGGYTTKYVDRDQKITKIDTKTNTRIYLELDNTTKKSLTTRKQGAVVVGKYIYIFGGATSSAANSYNYIFKFDTETETITKLSTTLPEKIENVNAVLIGQYVYVFGFGTPFVDTAYFYKFDTITETVINEIPLSGVELKAGNRVIAVGKYAYFFGGSNTKKIYKFDTESESFEQLSVTLPKYVSYAAIGIIDNEIYLLGGTNEKYIATNTILKFNIETETFETLDVTLPETRTKMSFTQIGDTIYLYCGTTKGNNDSIAIYYLNDLLKFRDVFELTNNKALVYMALKTTLNQIYINVNKVYKGNANNYAEELEAYLYNGSEWVLVGTYGVYEDTNGDVVLAGDIIATDDNNGNVVIS